MPDGVVQWFDRATGEGRVVHAGRRYVVRAEDMETRAQSPGARVHFDIAPEGRDTAVNVSLRAGGRMRPHHRRFGQTAGARSADTAGGPPSLSRLTELGHGLERHPGRVVQLWASLLAAGDLVNLTRLYAPDAALLTEGDVLVGTDAIRRHWAASPMLGAARARTAGDDDGSFVATWPRDHAAHAPASRMWIEHGEIVEQWVGSASEVAVVTASSEETPLTLSTSGDVSADEWNYAIDKIGKALAQIDAPILFASVRLERSADPGRERGATAKVTIDLDGRPVRARVAAAGMAEAIDLLEARLLDRLRHLAAQERALRRRGVESAEGGWRHGDAATARPPVFPRPVEEREIVRRKTWTPSHATPDEAIFDLESMDHDVFLFTDLATGDDAVVWRHGDGHRLQLLGGAAGLHEPSAVDVALVIAPAPRLTLHDARERLDAADEPWLFFRDETSGRGNLLYRRYDGHYGLITPAAEA